MVQIQTMKLDLENNYLIYTKPSKIWEINKEKLIKFEYFEKLFNMNKNDNIYVINNISDNELELFLQYIDNDKNLNELEIDDIMLLIKISDFLLLPDLFKKAKNEFISRL